MTYKVLIEPEAERDILSIIYYINDILKSPEAAKRIYTKFKKKILSLSDMPERCSLINEEPYKSNGIRKLLVDNYIVFFFVDKKNREVHVFRILYKRREWQNLI